MSTQYSKSLLEELKNSKGYDLVLLTTYNIDIDYFDRRIKSVFLGNGIRNICLFVDMKKLNQEIQNGRYSDLGQQYSVYPINITGAFHPKLILLLGKDKAKLFVSSANLTVSGYRYNNEIFNCYNYTSENHENSKLINDTVRMFIDLQDCSVRFIGVEKSKHEIKDVFVYNYLRTYRIDEEKTNQNCIFIHNLKEPIIDQIKENINSKISRIRISSPFFDNDLRAVKSISEHFDCNNIEVFIQNKLNRFPIELNKKHKVVSQSKIRVFDELTDGDNNFYHGKVIELLGEKKSYILFGSPNCTSNALLKTYETGGNIEASILCTGNKKEYDYFFNNFNINKNLELESTFQDEEKEDEINFSFVYGQLKNDEINLYIKYKEELNNLVIKYKENKLKYVIDKEIIQITLPLSIYESDSTILSINIFNNKKEYPVWCWFIDFKNIDYFRNNISIDSSLKYTYSDDDDKYYEFVMNVKRILDRKIESNSSWLYKGTSNQTYDENYPDDEEGYDYVIDDPIADLNSYEGEYFLFRKGVRSISTHYYNRLLKIDSEKKEQTNNRTTKDKTKSENETKNSNDIDMYVPLSGMNKLGRYIKRLTKNYLSDVKNNMIPSDVYIELSGLILCTLQKYYYDEKYKNRKKEDVKYDDFLNKTDVIEIRHTIAKNMTDLAIDNLEDDERKEIIAVVLDYVIEIGHYYTNEHLEDPYDDLKTILLKLNQKLNIREDVDKYINGIKLTTNSMSNIFKFNPNAFVNELFGYKTSSQLSSDFINKYGEGNVTIEDGEKVFCIKIKVDDLNKNKSLPIKNINSIINSLYEKEKNYDTIRIIYSNINNQFIEYEVKFVMKRKFINEVTQKNCIDGHVVSKKCRKLSTAYVPEMTY